MTHSYYSISYLENELIGLTRLQNYGIPVNKDSVLKKLAFKYLEVNIKPHNNTIKVMSCL
jgi:hypothetical protein